MPNAEELSKRPLDLLWPFCVLAVVIGSLLPAQSAPSVSGEPACLHNDQVKPFCAYAMLAFLPTLYEQNLQLWIRLLFSLALGIALEFGQLYPPERSFDTMDMLPDAAGACCGSLLGLLIRGPLGSIG